MKKIFILFILLISLFGCSHPPKVDLIIQNYLKVQNRENRQKSLKNLQIDMSAVLQIDSISKGSMAMTIFVKDFEHLRMEGTNKGKKFTAIINPNYSWIKKNASVEELTEKSLEDLKFGLKFLTYNFADSILEIANKNFKSELIGLDTIEFKMANKIKFTSLENEESGTIFYFDTEKGYIIRYSQILDNEENISALFSNYKKINNVYFPRTIDIYNKGKILLSLSYNYLKIKEPFSDSLFDVAMLKKEAEKEKKKIEAKENNELKK